MASGGELYDGDREDLKPRRCHNCICTQRMQESNINAIYGYTNEVRLVVEVFLSLLLRRHDNRQDANEKGMGGIADTSEWRFSKGAT